MVGDGIGDVGNVSDVGRIVVGDGVGDVGDGVVGYGVGGVGVVGVGTFRWQIPLALS